ncbi:hypothetical protein Zmor_021263 [Zophobas morio]|uniref:Chitin-binding type-4 domain-containing protein n=1 Tax=Zophobas morio TaxID=2755281 RepID=A0AA38MAI9_9CUCU|nr:hypothetical protein Zmor_021263 [Zophobas morio]
MYGFLATLICFSVLVTETFGHGMMLEPPNRSSLWRSDSSAPPNYSDNQVYCGGLSFQWNQMNGNCGVCGDPYNSPHPQDNENTGKYGQGKVVRQYSSGSVIDVQVYLSGNHLGNFVFSLCDLKNPNAPEPGEDCFQQLSLSNGEPQYNVSMGEVTINIKLKLPAGLTCERCVLRWHYTAGNNWGTCEDGSYKLGCGPQENFRNCADVAIV